MELKIKYSFFFYQKHKIKIHKCKILVKKYLILIYQKLKTIQSLENRQGLINKLFVFICVCHFLWWMKQTICTYIYKENDSIKSGECEWDSKGQKKRQKCIHQCVNEVQLYRHKRWHWIITNFPYIVWIWIYCNCNAFEIFLSRSGNGWLWIDFKWMWENKVVSSFIMLWFKSYVFIFLLFRDCFSHIQSMEEGMGVFSILWLSLAQMNYLMMLVFCTYGL